MRKFFTIFFGILILLTGNISYAEGDLWDNFGDQNVYGQKPVTDEEFEKALESKQKKKKKDKNIPKGEEFRQSNETDFVNNIKENLPIICISAPLKIGEEGVLPVGHYQVKGEIQNGQPRIKLYQSHYLMADFPATETNEDFDQPEINFVGLLDYNENQYKLIFGSVDFNAYAIVNIAQ